MMLVDPQCKSARGDTQYPRGSVEKFIRERIWFYAARGNKFPAGVATKSIDAGESVRESWLLYATLASCVGRLSSNLLVLSRPVLLKQPGKF